MASTDSLPCPRKNVAYRIYFAIYKNDGTLITGASGLDSEISKDGAAFADCTNEATEIGSSGTYLLDLTSTEMNTDNAMVVVKTSSTGAVIPTFSINPQETGDIKVDVQSLLGTAWLTPGTAGTPDVNVKLWNALTTVELPLVPTTAGRKLDVSAGGEAGVDWANVGSPTTSLALTGTTIATTQKVDVETIKTNPVVNGGTITFPTTATLASTTNITAGTVTTATNVTTVNGLAANVITATSINADAITAAKIADGAIDAATFAAGAINAAAIAADAITDAKVAADVTIASVTGSVGSVTGAVGSVTGAVGSVTGAVGSVTGNVGGNVTGSIGSLAAQAKADVNAEALDVLNTDTYAEPAQGAPGATITLAAKIGYLFKAWRNKTTQTASQYSLYNDDAATVDHKSAVSDDATTMTRGEVAAGP